jgi:glucosamine--fructose-6-phosphate aminotransferase (isomerizing)
MCGIIAFKSQKGLDVNEVIVSGLKRLEYRGYDSFGIAYLDSGKIVLVRNTGKMGDFSLPKTISNAAVGHTRWATHGRVTVENAHPHLSMSGKIAVIHNGIIENYQEIKKSLIEKGFSFKTETDTEVIPDLIEDFIKSGFSFFDSFLKSINALEGSFAVVALCGNEIIGARNGSPLVFGIDDSGNEFLGSDVPAFLNFTKKVVFLEDGEVARLGSEPKFFSYKTGLPVKKEITEIKWTIEQAEKGNYPHFMLKEINEQPGAILAAIRQDKILMEKVSSEIKSAVGIFFVGAGTSYHACLAASYLFSHIAKRHVNVALASEFSNYEEFINEKTLVFAVSQSGETIDLLDAVKSAKGKGAKIISIVNVMGSTLMRISDLSIMMNAGPEICVLSTKSYTSELAIMILLAYSAAGKESEGREIVERASRLSGHVLSDSAEMMKILAAKIKNAHDIFAIGRDLSYPTALEAALKIKEVSYIHAEGFAGGELKHGSIALIEEKTPAIVFSDDFTRKQILSNAMEIKARGGFVIGIDSVPNESLDFEFLIPRDGYANLIISILPIQLLAYYLALERGCDPDKPRNLAKSVTVK